MHQSFRRIIAGCLAMLLVLTSVPLGSAAGFMLPAGLERIEAEAFQDASMLTGLVELPEKVTEVEDNAFAGSGVFALSFPASVAEIGKNVLKDTPAVYAVVHNPQAKIAAGALPAVSYLFGHSGSTAQAYAEQAGIEFVSLDALRLENGFYYQVGENAALLCAKDATTVSGELTIPETVAGKPLTSIRAAAFSGCAGLTKLTLPAGAEAEEGAFDVLPNTEILWAAPKLEILEVYSNVRENISAGAKPTWVVRTRGGQGVVRYRFELKRDGETVAVQDYEAKSFFAYTLTEPGSYVLQVSCMDEAENVCTASAAAVKVKAGPLEIVSVTGSVSTCLVGQQIDWTVQTKNGSQPVQYGYTVLCDGMTVENRDFSETNVFSYVPAKPGYYVVEVICLDDDGTILEQQSEIVTVLSQEAAKPAAPVLIFKDGVSPFSAAEGDAPTYGLGTIQVSWQAVSHASSYHVSLDRQVGGQWENVLLEQGISVCDMRLDAALFADVTGRTLYRFGISSQGMLEGDVSYSYFAVEKVAVNESIRVNGTSSLTWNQAHCYGSVRSFRVTSQLPWTATADVEWLECLTMDDGSLQVTMQAQEQIVRRNGTITVTNGVNSATIAVCQDSARNAPFLLSPILSDNRNQPTSMPTGDFRLEWNADEFGYSGLWIYELLTDGSQRQVFQVYTEEDQWDVTALNLVSGSTYLIELKGFYSSNYKTCEVAEDALTSRYYISVTDQGHWILVNGKSQITLGDVTTADVFVTASNFFTFATDVDWISVTADSGDNEEKILAITAVANSTASAREGHVTLTCGTAQAVVTVRQESMLPVLLKPAGLSQNESSPTTLYADLNLLSTSYEFFLYRGDSISIAKGSSGSYGEETVLDTGAYGIQSVRLETSELGGNSRYRITVTNGDLTTCYYVKMADNDGESYDDIVVDGSIMRKHEIGVSAQSISVPIEAKTSWRASSDASWLSLSRTSGSSGTTTLTVTASANTTGKDRKGIVTVASTSSSCEGWLVVEQSGQDFMELYYYQNTDVGFKTYDPALHCTMLDGKIGSTFDFQAFSSLECKVTSNTSWITLSSKGATSTTVESGESFYLYLEDNATGAPRTGTVTVTCGSVSKTISVTQAPALGDLKVVSPELSTDTNNPSILQYGDTVVTWEPVANATYYELYTSYKPSYKAVINPNGSNRVSFTVPQEWIRANYNYKQSIYITAYDQYGFYERTRFYFKAVNGDAALVNGSSSPTWSNADDTATSEDFVIQSSQDWTASANASWISLSTASGSSGDTLTVSLSENLGAAREGTVTITVGTTNTVLRITQCAYLAQEKPVLSSPALSVNKTAPTVFSQDNLTSLSFTWEKEPQAWSYSLKLAQCTSDTARKTIAQSGTLRKDSYTFEDLELVPGELYEITFDRFSDRYGHTKTFYYMTIAPEDAWVLVENEASWEEELDGGEDHTYLNITASGYWQASTQDNWILLDDVPVRQADLDEDEVGPEHYNGYGNTSGKDLCVSVLRNTGSQPRTGTVTVTSGGATATILIRQYQNYQVAQLVSPGLSTTSSEMPTLPHGNVVLRWSGAQGGTGNYEVTLYESESQRTGYYRVYEKSGITSTSHTIPAGEFTEGMYYRLWFGTEVAEDDYSGQYYYFRMGYANALAADVSIAESETAVGQHLGVTVSARGGAGGYKYAFKLMQGDTVLEETPYENVPYHSFAPKQEGSYYVRVTVKDAAGTVISVNSQNFQAEAVPDTIRISRNVWAAGAQAEEISLTVESSAAWKASASDGWITVTSSGSGATIRVSENTAEESRSGSVTFTAGTAVATLSVMQEAKAPQQAAAISLSMATWNITDVTSAAATNLTVTAEGSWSASAVPEWISMTKTSGSGTTDIQLMAAANPGAARSAQILFTCGADTVSLLVAQAGSEIRPRVTVVSASDLSPLTGEEVTFKITSVYTDTLIFTVDGVAYDRITVTGDTTVFTRAFTEGGSRQVTFVPVRGAVIGEASKTLNMEVESRGALPAPRITCAAEAELGQSVKVTWTPVDNADYYLVNLWRDDLQLVRETRWQEAEYTLEYEALSCAGTYVFHVMAVGKGYSQSESAEIITVTHPTTSAKLTAPKNGNIFDVGNVMGLQASNPEGRPVSMQLYRDGEQIARFPETGTVTALDPYYEYKLTEAGDYQANLTVYGAAGNVLMQTNKVSFTVNGPVIKSGTSVAGNASVVYTDQTVSFKIVTNTAVSSVTVTDGSESRTVTGGGTLNTSNWTRTFEGTLAAPAEGKHVVSVVASDDYGHTAKKSVTYYAVTRDSLKPTVYPQSAYVELTDLPGSKTVNAGLYPSDQAELLGTYGNYRYIRFGNVSGFVSADAVGPNRLTTWDGLDVSIPMLRDGDLLGCVLAKDIYMISWACSVNLPASAQYRAYLVNGAGIAKEFYPGSNRWISVVANELNPGKYTLRVEVISADGAVTYLRKNSQFGLDLKESYTDLFIDLDGETYNWLINSLIEDYNNLTNLYRFFSNGYKNANGELVKADLEKLTENAAAKCYQVCFGDALTATGEKHLRYLSIAEGFMEKSASRNVQGYSVDTGLLQRILALMGLPSEAVKKICAYDGVKDILNTKDYKQMYDKFEELTKEHELDFLGIINGLENGMKLGEILTNIICKYALYSNADHAEIDRLIADFTATGNENLKNVALYLEALNNDDTLLIYLVAGYGGKAIADKLIGSIKDTTGEILKIGLSCLPGGFAVAVATEIGVGIGTAINNFAFNLDEIQNKACQLQWRIDATKAYYDRLASLYSKFLYDPVGYYEEFANAAVNFEMVLTVIYQGWADFSKANDESGWNKLKDLVKFWAEDMQLSTEAQYHADTLPALALQNLGTTLDRYYYHFLIHQGVPHVDIPSIYQPES